MVSRMVAQPAAHAGEDHAEAGDFEPNSRFR